MDIRKAPAIVEFNQEHLLNVKESHFYLDVVLKKTRDGFKFTLLSSAIREPQSINEKKYIHSRFGGDISDSPFFLSFQNLQLYGNSANSFDLPLEFLKTIQSSVYREAKITF